MTCKSESVEICIEFHDETMVDDSNKDYTYDYCYEKVNGGETIKWTMQDSIMPDSFTRSNHVELDKPNIAIINVHNVVNK